jgi:hypothetical protein
MLLRSQAAMAYDRASLAKASSEEIAEAVEPLSRRLHQLVLASAWADLDGLILAGKRFENVIKSLENDIKVLREKIDNTHGHLSLLKAAAQERMTKESVRFLRSDVGFVTMTYVNGKEVVTLR